MRHRSIEWDTAANRRDWILRRAADHVLDSAGGLGRLAREHGARLRSVESGAESAVFEAPALLSLELSAVATRPGAPNGVRIDAEQDGTVTVRPIWTRGRTQHVGAPVAGVPAHELRTAVVKSLQMGA